jgi:hypothetical protein
MLSGLRKQTTDGVTQVKRFEPQICLRYSGRQGVATKGSKFKTRLCDPWERFSGFIKDSANGDIFDLGNLKVPCRLCGNPRSLAELRQKLAR